MTKDNAKDYLPFVQALADGKTVQIKIDGVWMDQLKFSFTWPASDYRIKPEPRHVWVNRYAGGWGDLHASLKEAKQASTVPSTVLETVEFVEVVR